MSTIKNILVITLLVLTTIQANNIKNKELNIVCGFDKPPFIFGITTKKGIEPELLVEAFNLVNYKINITQVSKNDLQTILDKKNNIDAAATVSKKNNKLFYSDTFTSYENYAITRKSDNIKINSIDELSNVKFVSWQGSYNDLGDKFNKLFNPKNGTAKLVYHENSSQENDVKMFFEKQVDAIVIDKTIFRWYKLHLKNDKEYTFHKIFKHKTTYPVTFRSRKLRDDFNIGLRKLKETGRYDEIVNFYETQNIEELLNFAKLIQYISGKYIFEQKSKQLKEILKLFFNHPDIESIMIENKNKSSFLNIAKGIDKSDKKISTIYNNIYYNNGEILHIGQVHIEYIKNYKTSNGILIPDLNNFKHLPASDFKFIESCYTKLNLINKIKFNNKELKYIKTKKTVNVCIKNNQEPLVIKEKNGYSGVSIDYLNIISDYSNLEFNYIYNTSEKCDITLLTITQPNQYKSLTPTTSYASDILVLSTSIDKPFITNLNTLTNEKIMIQKGDESLKLFIKNLYPNLNIIEVEKIHLDKIVDGEFFGVISNSYFLSYHISLKYQYKLKIMTNISDKRIEASFGINNKEPLLLSIFNKSINKMEESTKQKILNSYKTIKVQKKIDYDLVWKILGIFIFISSIGIFFIIILKKSLKKELEKNRQKDKLMFQQNRLAQMGETISIIAHQWRQPLNTLSMLNQSIILKYKKDKLDSEFVEYFKINSNNQIDNMSKTIDDFKDFFKPEKEKIEFSINDVIVNIMDMVKPIFIQAKIDIVFDNNKEFKIIGYPNELGQGILNIINNAKDALIDNNIKNKQIDISIKKDNKNIILTISDNAGGIPENILDKIFDPYFSTKDEKNGTGLGLYMVKIIVEEHMNGKLSVSNNTQGSVFLIKF